MNNNNLYNNNNFIGITHLDNVKITSNFILQTSNILEQHILNTSNTLEGHLSNTSNILEDHILDAKNSNINYTNALRTDVNKWINEEIEHVPVPIPADIKHTYIYNSNLVGEIRFWCKSTPYFPPQIPGDYPPHRVKIDADGKLKLYYTYDQSINATWMSGWMDIVNVVVGLIANDFNTGVTIGGIQLEILGLNDKIDIQVEGIYNALALIEAGDLEQDYETLKEYRDNLSNLINYAQAETQLDNIFTNLSNLIQTRNTSYLTRIQTGITNAIVQNPVTAFFTGTGGVVLGIIYGLAQGQSFNGYLNSLTKSLDENTHITSTEKQTLKAYITDNLMVKVDIKNAELEYNKSVAQGFINYNITSQQYIRNLKCDSLNLNTGNISGINYINVNNIVADGRIKENNNFLDNIYLTSNHLYNLSYTYTAERQYPSKLYTTTQSEDTITLLGGLRYRSLLYLDNQSITYGSGFYEVYSSSSYDTPTTKDKLFNYNTTETITSPRWAINQYNSSTGNYQANNAIDNVYYGDWVIIKVPQAIMLTRYRIYQRSDFPTRAPSLWKVYGSKDGITFTEITEAHQTTRLTSYSSGYYEKSLNPSFTTLYNYIGFVFSALLSISGQTDLSFAELQIFGKEIISNSIVSNIYTTSNAVKNIVQYECPFLSKKYGFYISITTPININSTTFYKYDIDLRQYSVKGFIDIGSGTGDPYRIFKIKVMLAPLYFSTITNGLPDVCYYDVFLSFKANSAPGGTAGLNASAIGFPENTTLTKILPNNIFVIKNGTNSIDYITVISRSAADCRVIIEDLLS